MTRPPNGVAERVENGAAFLGASVTQDENGKRPRSVDFDTSVAFFWGSRRELYPLRRRDLHPGAGGAIFTGAGIAMLVKMRRTSAEFPFQARDLFPQQTIFSQYVCLLP